MGALIGSGIRSVCSEGVADSEPGFGAAASSGAADEPDETVGIAEDAITGRASDVDETTDGCGSETATGAGTDDERDGVDDGNGGGIGSETGVGTATIGGTYDGAGFEL